VKDVPASDPTDFQSAELKQAAKRKPSSASKPSESAVPQSQLVAEVELLEVLPDLPEADDEGVSGSSAPVPLCNDCGEPLDHRGNCAACGPKAVPAKQRQAPPPTGTKAASQKPVTVRPVREGAGQPRTPRKAEAQSSGPRPRPQNSATITAVGPKKKRPAKPTPDQEPPINLDPFLDGDG
jgi:hypothetical protein